ncbi:GreA/GreB family elongation factor [Photobacterium galatheae]|nr:GreA/GreB family elongation factor [Photobacterium galatheae]MCM0149196.1 GreA/GreB family elongation factor [Photobacterium galatheae]
MVNKPYISLGGFNKITEEIRILRGKADEVVQQIKDNRETETGDESENVEMIRLMAERESISEKFCELEAFLSSCQVVDIAALPEESEVVRFGTKVRLLELDTEKQFTYTILGERESSVRDHIISHLSPLGRALMNEYVGNIVSFDTPNGERELEILEISRHK